MSPPTDLCPHTTGITRRSRDTHGPALLGHRPVESSAIGPHRQTYALNPHVSRGLLLNIPLFYGQATPMSKQHQALVQSSFAPLILVCFSIRCVPCVLPDALVLRCTLFMFCVKAVLLAKRAATCDKVETSDNFDGWMSQQYCEWITDKVDERKLSDKSPIPCPDQEECFVAHVNPLLVNHHLRFKPPEDGLHVYHASWGA